MRTLAARGYTLIELLISTALMLIVIGLVVAAARGGFLRMGAFSEGHEQTERALNLSARLQNDLDTAGVNMLQISSEGAGTETPYWLGNGQCPDYDTSTQGVLVKTGTDGFSTSCYSSRVISDGPGSFTFTPPWGSCVGVIGSDSKYFSTCVGWGSWQDVIDSTGTEVAVTCCTGAVIAPHAIGDQYTFAIENSSSGIRVVKLYRIRSGSRSLMWTYNSALPAYPIGFYAYIYTHSTSITNLQVTGAPIVDSVLQPHPLAHMPLSADGQITWPVFLHMNPSSSRADGFTALRGDPTVDVSRTASDFNPRAAASPVTLTVATPTRGSYSTASLALLVDYIGNHSLLLKVSSSTAQGANTSIQATPVLSTNSADGWNGLFWSNDSDYQYIYPAGSTLIKLADPIEYRWDSIDTLFRREGLYPWSIAATGVADFQVTETRTPSNYYIHVTSRLMPDNAYTQSDRTMLGPEIVDQTFAPRALNSTYHQ